VDTITYTQFLNEDGKMEADVTVCKLSTDKFIVIATDTMHRHVETWLSRHLDPTGTLHVVSHDVTGGYAQLNIQGPRSRELLQAITDANMEDEMFPFRAARTIAIGHAPVLCARITYVRPLEHCSSFFISPLMLLQVGELGFELHIPTEFSSHVYDRIMQVGPQYGLVHAGLKALGSLRLEKGYRDYGHDMDNMDRHFSPSSSSSSSSSSSPSSHDSLMEVGLSFTANFTKPGGFIGDRHVKEQKDSLKQNSGLPRRLVQYLVLDPEPMVYHGEVIWRNGQRVGDVRIGSYGHTLGGAVGLAMIENTGEMVNKNYLETGHWEIEVAEKKFPVKVSLAPMYDPKNARIKM
jgi:glycine cleavage system aminomethyltransferase T